MATLTGVNLLDSIIDSTGIEPNALIKATLAAKLQQMIDNGTYSKLAAAIAISGFSTEINSGTDISALGDAVETNTGLIEAAADDAAVDAIDFPDYSGPVVIDYTLTASAESVEEGKALTFTVTASQAVTEDTAVTFNIITDGYDAEEDDFQSPQLTQTATILAGETTATFNVNPPQDGVNEDTESFGVSVGVAGETLTADSEIIDIDSREFVLTTNRDIETANIFYASQTQYDVDGRGPTLQASDILTGFADRTDNKLIVEDLTPGVTNSNLPTGLSLNNIQTVELNSTGNTSGAGFSTLPFASVLQLTGNTDGAAGIDLYMAQNANSGTETTVDIMQTAYAGGTGVMVTGGHDVTVTSNGGAGVMVGNQTLTWNTAVVPAVPVVGASVPTDEQVVTGVVNVTQNNTAAGGINIYGGTDVTTVTTSTSNTGAISIGNTAANTGNSVPGAIANPTGIVDVTQAGTGAVTVFGGTDVTIDSNALVGGGAITVGDATNVAPSNLPSGNVTIDRDAAIAYNGLAGSTNNNTTGGTISVSGGVNVDINTNESNLINIGDLGTPAETALNPTGTITVINTGIVDNVAASLGTMNIAGGTDVTVETTGANVIVGAAANGRNWTSSNPTGNIEVTETMNGAGWGRAVTIDGGVDVTVNAMGQTVNIGTTVGDGGPALPTGAIVVDQSDIFTGNQAQLNGTNAGNITINGGTDVTVSTTGGNVDIGAVQGTVNAVPSGAVKVTNTFGGAGSDSVLVQGGTTVDITTTKSDDVITVGDNSEVLNTQGDALKSAALASTGDVTIVNKTVSGSETAYGTGVVDVDTNGATTVSVTGGNVGTIRDIQSVKTTGGSAAGTAVGTSTLANVVIDGQVGGGVVALQSDALTSLTLTNQQGSGGMGTGTEVVTITNDTAAHDLTITQGGNNKPGTAGAAATNQIVDAKAGTVTINDNGTASSATLRVDATKATSVTIDNDANAVIKLDGVNSDIATVTLTGEGNVTFDNTTAAFGAGNLSKVMNIDASGATGNVVASLAMTTVNDKVQTYKGGSGVDTVTISANPSGWSSKATIDGGNGSADVLVADYAAAVSDVALGNAANVTGFEILHLGTNADSAANTYDASGFNTIQTDKGGIAGNVEFTNVAANATLDILGDATNNRTITATGANVTNTNNAMTINLGTAGSAATDSALAKAGNLVAATTGAITADGIEALTINAVGGYNNPYDATTQANVATVNDTASNGKATLTIGGTSSLQLTSNGGFTSIDASGNTGKTVNVDAAEVSNNGTTFTGGAAKLQATGSNATANTEVLLSLGGTGSTPFANNDSVEVEINGNIYQYTNATGGAVSAAAMATGLRAQIEANRAAGDTHGVSSTVSGGSIVLSKAALFSATISQATDTGAGTFTASSLGGVAEQVLTISGTATAAVATAINIPNGQSVNVTPAANGETASAFAIKLAAAINQIAADTTASSDGNDGVTVASANGDTVVLTGGNSTNGIFQAALNTAAVNGYTVAAGTQAINMGTVANVVNSGTGGVEYTAGLGGSWDTTTHTFSSGSETINLAASTEKTDTINLNSKAIGTVITNNGSTGGVNDFVLDSLAASDVLNFEDDANGAQAKTIVSNQANVQVITVADCNAMASVLDPSGALYTKLSNLTYAISNGVITFGATGANSINDFTTGELVSAAQIIVNSGTNGGANRVVAFSTGGDTFVVASDNGNTLQAGVDNATTVVQLNDVSSVKGFGTTSAEGTIVSTSVTMPTAATIDSGASAASQTLDYKGAAHATVAFNATNATDTLLANNLAASATLDVNDAVAGVNGTVGIIETTQIGTSGHNSLTVNAATNDTTVERLTVSGDNLVVLANDGSALTLTEFVDATSTLTNLNVGAGAGTTTITNLTASALTTVDTTGADGAVVFCNSVANAFSNNGVTFTLDADAGDNFTGQFSGSDLTFQQKAAGAAVVTLTVTGSNSTIDLGLSTADNALTVTGANSEIKVGTGTNTVVATGSDNAISVASDANADLIQVGTGATVNLGTAQTANTGGDTVFVQSAVAGGDSSDFSMTTINSATGTTLNGGLVIDFEGTAAAANPANTITYGLLGGAGAAAVAASQVNVASATTLEEALDMAANYVLLTQDQGTTVTATGTLAANTGAISWMQYDGDTYVIGMVNDTGNAVQQTGIDSNDIVVKLTGLVDLVETGAAFAVGNDTLTI